MKKRATKTARLGLFIEPELRSAIEREASRREIKMSRVVRTMLRDQLAILMLANGDTRSVSA